MSKFSEKVLFDFDEKKREEYGIIAGCDEAGRGPLAGPVVAAAVILSGNEKLPFLNDSKKLKEETRENLFIEIYRQATAVRVFCVSPKKIDEINILNASLFAMYKCLETLKAKWNCALIDGNKYVKQIPQNLQETIVKGDGKSASIAAASIVAKVVRDRIMKNYHKKYPEYNFAKHKGYPTKEHYEAIKKFGLSPIHRLSFCKNINSLFSIFLLFSIFFLNLPCFSQSLKDQRNDAFFTHTGDALQYVLPASAGVYSIVLRDKEGLRSLAYSFGSTLILTYSLKYTVARPRPFQDANSRGDSFPSGHTASAFSGAAYWHKRYGLKAGIPAYILACAAGYSRVWSGWHHWEDVLAGAAIGTAFSYLFTQKYEKVQVSAGANITPG
ncbi:MAG: ribonuclease HII, partial [Chitinivibrionia bacterium]|nr:ribonuclease HII [Chitinivibrionia bacterium]